MPLQRSADTPALTPLWKIHQIQVQYCAPYFALNATVFPSFLSMKSTSMVRQEAGMGTSLDEDELYDMEKAKNLKHYGSPTTAV